MKGQREQALVTPAPVTSSSPSSAAPVAAPTQAPETIGSVFSYMPSWSSLTANLPSLPTVFAAPSSSSSSSDSSSSIPASMVTSGTAVGGAVAVGAAAGAVLSAPVMGGMIGAGVAVGTIYYLGKTAVSAVGAAATAFAGESKEEAVGSKDISSEKTAFQRELEMRVAQCQTVKLSKKAGQPPEKFTKIPVNQTENSTISYFLEDITANGEEKCLVKEFSLSFGNNTCTATRQFLLNTEQVEALINNTLDIATLGEIITDDNV